LSETYPRGCQSDLMAQKEATCWATSPASQIHIFDTTPTGFDIDNRPPYNQPGTVNTH